MFKNKSSKIYISGHTGFVGNALYSKLKEIGYRNIIVYTRKEKNLLNQKDVESIFKENNIDYVFICSAKVGGIKANIKYPFEFLYENLQIQNNLIYNCLKYNIKKSVFLGSSCIYPKDYKQPLKEEYLLKDIPEYTNEGYSLSKIAGLKLCEYVNKQYRNMFIPLMPSNIYGKGDNFDNDNSHVLSALVRKIVNAKTNKKKYIEIWGSGKPRREFIYIDDLIDCIIWSMNKYEFKFMPYSFLNVGSGTDVSILELANKIKDIIQWNGTFKLNLNKPDGMYFKRLDTTKINNEGWKYKTSLKDGLKKTIDFYINNIKSREI